MAVNRFEVGGYLVGREISLQFSAAGNPWLKGAQLAHTERKKDGDKWVNGETSYFDLTAFGRQAEILSELPARTFMEIVGMLRIEQFEGSNGERRRAPKLIVREVKLPLMSPDMLSVDEDFISLRRLTNKKQDAPVPNGIEDYNEEPF